MVTVDDVGKWSRRTMWAVVYVDNVCNGRENDMVDCVGSDLAMVWAVMWAGICVMVKENDVW